LTGRTKTYYVRETVIEHLNELEEIYLAEHILERVRAGKEKTIGLDEVMKNHGLES